MARWSSVDLHTNAKCAYNPQEKVSVWRPVRTVEYRTVYDVAISHTKHPVDNMEATPPPGDASAEWLQQFDPRSQQHYYYNIVSGAVQWERPPDFVGGVDPNPETRGAVVIQSAFRGKRSRDAAAASRSESSCNIAQEEGGVDDSGGDCEDRGGRVDAGEEGNGVDNEENEDWQSLQDEGRAAGDGGDDGADYTISAGVEHGSSTNDGRHQQSEAESSAALSIQCAVRQRAANKAVETKRSHLRDITDPDVINRKIADLVRAMDEVQSEIQTRRLVSEQENDEFPHLRELLRSWTAALDALQDRILVLPNRGEHVKKIEFAGEKIVRAQELHDAMAEARSDCLALLRSIFLMNSYFLELDVRRVNDATAALQRWKQHELCALADPRIVKAVQLDDLHDVFAHAEAALRRAMGLTDFNAHATSAAGKRYEEWHAEASAALTSVRQMEQRLEHKIHLLHVVRLAQVEKRETALMETEDRESAQLEAQQRARVDQAEAYVAFLAKCREGWQKGLEKRQADLQTELAAEAARQDAVARKLALIERMHKRDLHRRSAAKLSIWEAVKEGLPVEIVRTMVFAEMQKARRLGYDFELRTARSDYGETLIQIACWWGHESADVSGWRCLVLALQHLVAFLLEEGAYVHDVDSHCNKFSLLHDVARRGHEQVVRACAVRVC
ncbi:hypothetical protein PybrP1_003168 [[Pythium] brassicae (nom. inval.)]|nr:hypothetical protein PybrP1_003168 [[Pythium] brassicae (nom. inval.)]